MGLFASRGNCAAAPNRSPGHALRLREAIGRAGGTLPTKPDLSVLIVEDQAILAMDLELTLTESGCDVIGCTMDAPSSLALAAQERPDLAFVDLNLLDGLTGPRIARELVRDHGAAVVFLTANPEQIPEGFGGALGAVVKPFDERTIRAVVDFARGFIRGQAVGAAPRRFRMAPWLTRAPEAAADPAISRS